MPSMEATLVGANSATVNESFNTYNKKPPEEVPRGGFLNRIKPNIEQKHCLIFDTFSLLLLFVSDKLNNHDYKTESIAHH